jgi:hypothetical protein
MASENQLVIEIVLDDGSIKQGFARVKSEAKKATEDVSKNTEISGKKLADNLTSPITSAFERIGVTVSSRMVVISAAAVAAGIAIQQAFKFTLIGEEVQRVTGQFDRFAANAGLFGPQIRQGLEQAAGGLVDLERILDTSAATFAELGTNAARLPQILETARNIGVATGRDVGEVFEALNRAILTGNTRALQQIGVFIKADEVIKKYADSIGVADKNITEQVRQTALLEEVTGRLNAQFANSGAGLAPVKTAFTQLKVAFDDLIDAIGVRANQAFGGIFAGITRLAADAVSGVANALNPKAIETSAQAAEKIKTIQEQIIELSRKAGADLPGNVAIMKQWNAEIDRTVELQKKLIEQEAAAAASIGDRADIDKKEQLRIANEKAAEAAAKLFLEQQKLEQLNQNPFGPITAAALETDAAIEGLGNHLTTVGAAMRIEANNIKVTFGDLAKTINSAVVNGMSAAFSTLGRSLATGGNAMEDFGKSVLNSIGGLAIQLGQFFILVGAGLSGTTALLGLSGGAAIAAGIGLTVLGGALQGLSGNSTGGVDAAGGAGGATFAESGVGTAPGLATDNEPTEERGPQTEIVVNFEGDILGDESAGRRIVDLINSAFDSQGVKVRRGVLA